MNEPYQPKRARFLSPEALDEAVEHATARAATAGIEVAIGGGFAMQCYGSDRLTADIDVVAAELLELDEAPETTLTFGGVRFRAPNGAPIDWIVRNDDWAPVYEAALRDAIATTAGYRLITPEWLIVLKMIAGRPKDDGDIMMLMASDDIGLDLDRARELVRTHLGLYAVGDFDSHLNMARALKQRGERP